MENNQFDLAIILVFMVVGLFSFLKGFARDFCSTTSWLFAIICSHLIGKEFVVFLKPYIPNLYLANIVSYSLLFIIMLVIFYILIAKFLRPILEKIPNPIDQSLGFGFGVAKSYIILSFLFVVAASIYGINLPSDDKRFGPKWLKESKSYAILEFGALKVKFIKTADLDNIIANSTYKDVASFYDDKKDIEDIIDQENNDYNDKIQDLNIEELPPSIDKNADKNGGYKENERNKMNRLLDVISINDQYDTKDEEDNEQNNIESKKELINIEENDISKEESGYIENLFDKLSIFKNITDNLFGDDDEIIEEALEN
jgi:uncharacterized membrane protein required for colicin V production